MQSHVACQAVYGGNFCIFTAAHCIPCIEGNSSVRRAKCDEDDVAKDIDAEAVGEAEEGLHRELAHILTGVEAFVATAAEDGDSDTQLLVTAVAKEMETLVDDLLI